MLLWISQNGPALGFIATLVAAIIPLYQFTRNKKAEERRNNFDNYHKLIQELVDPAAPKLDRQIAIVFELRNFEKYFPVSIRILKGLKDQWEKNKDYLRLLQEIDLTLSYMEKRVHGD
jgi:restriction endonuclease S subunit